MKEDWKSVMEGHSVKSGGRVEIKKKENIQMECNDNRKTNHYQKRKESHMKL